MWISTRDLARFGYLHLRLLNPFPAEEVTARLMKAKRRIGVEMNFTGQLAGIVRECTGIDMSHLILKYNGRPMSQTELLDAIRSVLRGEASARMVLTRGT